MSFLHEGSIGIFGFGYVLDIFFCFCAKELWFFSFDVHYSYVFSIFGIHEKH